MVRDSLRDTETTKSEKKAPYHVTKIFTQKKGGRGLTQKRSYQRSEMRVKLNSGPDEACGSRKGGGLGRRVESYVGGGEGWKWFP